MNPHIFFLFLLLLSITTPTACQRNKPVEPSSISFHRTPTTEKTITTEKPIDTSVQPSDASPSTFPPLVEPGVKPFSDQELEQLQNGLGKDCLLDDDCPLYLRCPYDQCRVPLAISGNSTNNVPTVTFLDGNIQKASFFVEVAATDPQRMRGLMFRRSMKKNWGMLFIFDRDQSRSFWMKNTYIPLDMIFIEENGTVVNIIEHATPLSRTLRPSKAPCRYVLELYDGVAAKHHLKTGDHIKIQAPPYK